MIVFQGVASEEYHCVWISMPQPLAVLERGTADCVRVALTQAHQELRGLASLRAAAGDDSFHLMLLLVIAQK